MADNTEKSAAEAMAGSHTAGRAFVKDTAKNLWLFGSRNNSGSNSGSSSSSSSSTVGGQGTTGNGWTAEDYKNHNEYKQNEHARSQDAENNAYVRGESVKDNDLIRTNAAEKARHKRSQEAENNSYIRGESVKDNDLVRTNAAKNAKYARKELQRNNDVTRNNTILENAKKNGQVSSIDVDHKSGRQQIRFNDSPVRETNPGNGAGNQGGSTQQSQPGGRKAPAGKGKPKVDNPFETRFLDEGAKNSQDYLGDTRKKSEWATIDKKNRRDVANSYVTKGDKLTPAQKRQNTAARSYATPFKPGTTAGQAKAGSTRGKKA